MGIDLFDEAFGDRPNAPDVMIVVTDGEANRDPFLTLPTADAARDHGKYHHV